ncbi:protein kinase [Streptomyces nojiriensis]|uniref:serine/threonine-protein kinase n=1 Tax=Streptomyces nojiriensis TaxID=66374 RepID=UPI003692D20F
MTSGGFAVRMGDVLAGRYRLNRQLGHGGMGQVWRGHDLTLDRSVAVKVLLEAATNDEVVTRFRREATIGARLQHPGITVVHDVGQQEGRLFIVMELLAGEDLGSVLARERGGLPVAAALGMAAQTAEALAAAHEQAVVHRDLKPANLFLLPGGRVKICDFGIAHSSDATAGWTVTGRMFGTPAYMAPEQWRGEHVDARCDLYALGCVLYALLSGEPPFGAAEQMYVLMRRHIEDAPRPLGVSPELNRLVLALLAKAPADRPESAEAVAKDLRGLIGAGGATPAYVPTVIDPATSAPDAAAPDVPEPAWEFVRELLREAEEAVRAAPGGRELRVMALAVAANAAACFDSGLAGRLLADAEACAWTEGGGDGARIAGMLTILAQYTAARAPARTERLLTEAEQALFTVFGSNRETPLRRVAEELAAVAPERGVHMALHQLGDPSSGNRVWARAAVAVARTDPGLAERYLEEIRDAELRAATEADVFGGVADPDLPGALRLAEGIRQPGRRALILARLARTHAAAGDGKAAAEVLDRAEQTFSRAARERAAALREAAAGFAERGQLVQAERLRSQAENMLRTDAEPVGDPETDVVLGALADARRLLAQGPPAALDPASARERAAEARAAHRQGPERAHALARIARLCVAGGPAPWLPEVAADPGTPPDRRPVRAAGTDVPLRPDRLQALSGVPRWFTSATPGSVRPAGPNVAWLAGEYVGSVRADNGATLWTAAADAGVPAPPPAGPRTVALAADPSGATVCVAVQLRDGPGVRLLAREPMNGRVRWWRDLPGETAVNAPDPARFAMAGNLVLYGGREAVTALSELSGEEVWRHPGPFTRGLRMTVGENCLVLADQDRLTGLHLPSGAPLWPEAAAGAPAVSVGPVHVVDGTALRALHQGKGLPLWSFELGVPASGVLVEAGVVYAAGTGPQTRGDAVFAIDADSGRERWRRRVTARSDARDCVLELLGIRAGLLYVKSATGSTGLLSRQSGTPFLTALDLATGKPRWRWEHPGIGRPDAVVHGGSVVLPLPELTAIALP